MNKKNNVFVFCVKFTEYSLEDKDDIFLIETNLSLKEIKENFANYLHNYQQNMVQKNQEILGLIAKVEQENWDESTDNFKRLEFLQKDLEKFKEENHLFTINEQYLDVENFFRNIDEIQNYEIFDLENWLMIKKEETKKKVKKAF